MAPVRAAASGGKSSGPGTASHVADRATGDAALATDAEGDSAAGVMTKRMGTSSTTANSARNSPVVKKRTYPPPSSSQTHRKDSSKTSSPSAPVTVHPAPIPLLDPSTLSANPTKSTMRRPHLPSSTGPTNSSSPSSQDEAAPPDPALFTFPSLLSTLGSEASDPLHAIAEICGRSKMSLADEHGSHLPPTTSLLQAGTQQQNTQGKGVGDVRAEITPAAVQRVEGRGRRGSAPVGSAAAEGDAQSGKGWMEGVMRWLRGAGGEQGTPRERRKAVRDLRRVLEEREGEPVRASA